MIRDDIERFSVDWYALQGDDLWELLVKIKERGGDPATYLGRSLHRLGEEIEDHVIDQTNTRLRYMGERMLRGELAVPNKRVPKPVTNGQRVVNLLRGLTARVKARAS